MDCWRHRNKGSMRWTASKYRQPQSNTDMSGRQPTGRQGDWANASVWCEVKLEAIRSDARLFLPLHIAGCVHTRMLCQKLSSLLHLWEHQTYVHTACSKSHRTGSYEHSYITVSPAHSGVCGTSETKHTGRHLHASHSRHSSRDSGDRHHSCD